MSRGLVASSLFRWDGSWFEYTPTWTGSVTNPTIGNGSISGRYRRMGNSCLTQIKISIGSTTSVGSGSYSLSFPITPVGATLFAVGSAVFYDDSGAVIYHGSAWAISSTDIAVYVSETSSRRWTNSVPVTPATNDVMALSLEYPV
jgi:hypothetical protein